MLTSSALSAADKVRPVSAPMSEAQRRLAQQNRQRNEQQAPVVQRAKAETLAEKLRRAWGAK